MPPSNAESSRSSTALLRSAAEVSRTVKRGALRLGLLLFLTRGAAGCGTGPSTAPPRAARPTLPPAAERVEVTVSPRPDASPHRYTAACGEPDAGLRHVAEELLAVYTDTGVLVDSDDLTFRLRAAGLPYVWVRSWAATGAPKVILPRLEAWSSVKRSTVQRCGMATVVAEIGSGGPIHAAAVVADAPADVSPFPRQARVGQWLSFDARLNDPSWSDEEGEVSLVALGPRGLPYGVPVHGGSDGSVHGRFAVSSPGRWLLQLLASTAAGPRPVAEVEVFADVPIPGVANVEPAPGELRLPPSQASQPSELLGWVNRARATESLDGLTPDPTLTALALDHARAMAHRGQLAHDLGDGDAYIRVSPHLPDLSYVGENVARAPSVRAAHRSLWRSPSHRANLLDRHFTHIGVGVAHGLDGDVWLCQLFAAEGAPAGEPRDWPED